ncbi:MAG: DEAD/DEAH box helicase [Fusobacteriaceae bacterium]
MFEKVKIESNILYRGEIPFLLKKSKKNIVYLCSSKKNMNDYYWVLKDFYKGKIIKSYDGTDEDYISFNYSIIDAINKNEKFIVLVTLEFFLKEFKYFGNRVLLEKDKKIDLKNLIIKFEENGYKRNYLIEKRMDFSLRGNILDFFPINGEYPIRVELYDEVVERLGYFDIETQKTVEKKEKIDMYIDSNKKEISNFMEIFKDIKKASFPVCYMENKEILQYKLEKVIFDASKNQDMIKNKFLEGTQNFLEINHKRFLEEEIVKYKNYESLKEISKEKEIIIYSDEEKRYTEIFKDYLNVKINKYPLYEGFENNSILHLSDRELKGVRVRREKKQKIEIKHHDMSQIKEGDYIIHENFGVGIYIGLKLINDDEYLIIKYADEDRLYVPMGNLDKIERFQVEPGNEPEIYRIGRKGFKKKREKLKEDMLKFAKEIVEIQSKRLLNKGISFSRDTLWQEEFEDGFPYTLTKDQSKAIDDVKRDMEKNKVMDRIICGDVGCGKTEVAIRAAFKAVQDGKQVVLMVPTTILAQQHYERFKERFKNFPFVVEILSRLKNDKEQQECIKHIEKGGVDIIIGTHKIISKDIIFNDLGLVIIDEEQKFGVKAKERLKHLENNVDMLTLTATPIPRTLNLALLGIRDISIIESLPENRIPIQDFFIENSKEEIRVAIMKEFSREGQTFYIYNSVKNMERKLKELREIVPSFIKISSIHGQMVPSDIRDTLHEFESGEIDVLLSTTIIENGIDVENANTIIIEGIEKLGLSQMYQLRGRIGRGSERGYCYILVDNEKSLKAKSKMREESMRQLSDLGKGTGFHLSLEDMRIRGAGEVLGDKQHGALEVLGYGLYLKLIQEEVRKLKGEYIEKIEGFELKLLASGYIPDSYISKEEKIVIYKRVSEMSNSQEILDLKEELKDRFGKLPIETISYLRGQRIKLLAMSKKIISVVEKENSSDFKFYKDEINLEKIMKLLESGKAKYLKKEGILNFNGTIEEFLTYYS